MRRLEAEVDANDEDEDEDDDDEDKERDDAYRKATILPETDGTSIRAVLLGRAVIAERAAFEIESTIAANENRTAWGGIEKE